MSDRTRREEEARPRSVRAAPEAVEEREAERAPSIAIPDTQVVGEVHGTWGNATLADALYGVPLDGFGPYLAGSLASALSGVDDPDGGAPANSAMLRVLRERPIDWTHPALQNLDGRAGGQPLPASQLHRFEAAFGHDFGHVRVHADDQAARAAQELHAHAFALGAHLFFGPGEWEPGSAQTDRLLAHELTHVVQHDRGRIGGGEGVSSPSDPHEREAYANETQIVGRLEAFEAPAPTSPDALAMLGRRRPSEAGPEQVLALVARSRGAALTAPVYERLSGTLGQEGTEEPSHADDAAGAATVALDTLASALGADLFQGDASPSAAPTADGPALRRVTPGATPRAPARPTARRPGAPQQEQAPEGAGEEEATSFTRGTWVWVGRGDAHRPGMVLRVAGQPETEDAPAQQAPGRRHEEAAPDTVAVRMLGTGAEREVPPERVEAVQDPSELPESHAVAQGARVWTRTEDGARQEDWVKTSYKVEPLVRSRPAHFEPGRRAMSVSRAPWMP